ncbi:LEM3 (ligand-effect modulator 3) family / CDC50 family protein [Babesia caballi]|uniref:LEM3 (Ligand-effect modulator 3) family / CDC50 family protein n=1 Tax=Babesia caballi TaxID=5871 RepID=A0AAV4LRP7_BABCB|nr:LEM3 (ligand-effect modulator 3) family / CDC50 family protein [Babesia caballi]
MPTQRERERSVRHADRARVRTKRQSVGTTGARFSYVTAPSRDSWSTARLTPVDTVQDVLMRRRQEAETTAGLKRFRNDRSFDTMYTSRLYGIVLLLLGLMNVSLFSLLQWRRGFQAECTFVVPDRSPLGNDRWVRPITKQDCSGDLVRFQKAEKLYVYYSIFNYPFHGAAVFRLHSQKQMQGRSVSRDQTEACYPFNVVKVRGKEKVIHPCGAHIWNIYNDTFKFSSENPNVSPHYIPLDESVELLGYQQEYRDSRNPTQHDVLHTQ